MKTGKKEREKKKEKFEKKKRNIMIYILIFDFISDWNSRGGSTVAQPPLFEFRVLGVIY